MGSESDRGEAALGAARAGLDAFNAEIREASLRALSAAGADSASRRRGSSVSEALQRWEEDMLRSLAGFSSLMREVVTAPDAAAVAAAASRRGLAAGGPPPAVAWEGRPDGLDAWWPAGRPPA